MFHKEGFRIIITTFILCAMVALIADYTLSINWVKTSIQVASCIHDSFPVTTQIESSDGTVDDVPIYLLEGFKVWGATAMMLAEVKALFMGA